MEREINKDGIDVKVDGLVVTVKGKEELERNFDDPRYSVKIEDKGDLIIVSGGDDKKSKAIVGTITSHIKNMIIGVKNGFRYKVRVNSTHFPITVEHKDDYVIIKNFIGSRGIRKAKVLDGVKVNIGKDEITLEGANKENVSQTAANIESSTRLPKKDRRIFGDGCYMESNEIIFKKR